MNVAAQIDVLPEKPYPGLRAFLEEEWPIFFGREVHADEVIVRLGLHGLVLVHGASGCGKSSLVRAGVLSALESSHEVAGRTWRTATMRPSDGPISRLAEILEEAFPMPVGGNETEGGVGSSSWSDCVLKGGGLVDHIEQAVRADRGGSFCLLIDQFEEIFRWARVHSEAEARLFVEFLKAVGDNGEEGGFHVILTMRSDYFGQCAVYDGFAEFLNPRQYLLPRMDEFGLLRAIYEPAELYGGMIDPAVSAMLLPAVRAQVDGLPVLQHALMRASQHARGRVGPGEPWRVTVEDLAAVGGAENALAQHAEEVLARATQDRPELLEAAEWIFRALTDLDSDGRAIRRPCRLSELIGVSGVGREGTLAILDSFRNPDCSFICPNLPEPIADEDELDISHEALIRQWPRLMDPEIDPKDGRANGWVYREFFGGLVWQSLVVQATASTEGSDPVLSAASTEQLLPRFRRIEARPGWTKRHTVSARHDAASQEKEWRDVKAMMDASERNLVREQGMIGRLRRMRNGSMAVVVLVLIALVVVYAISYSQLQTEVERTERTLATLKRFVVFTTCADIRENSDEHRVCRAEAERQFFLTDLPSPEEVPSDSAPPPPAVGEGRR